MNINGMTPKFTLAQPHYNPERGAFEAVAHLHQAGGFFTYQVSYISAPHADFATVIRGLERHALAAHREAQARTQRLIRDTVRAATSRTKLPGVGKFLAA